MLIVNDNKRHTTLDRRYWICLNQCTFILKCKAMTVLMGMDEVGRGPLAGPVVAATIIIKPEKIAGIGVKDSKKLSKHAREKIYNQLISNCCAWSIGISSANEIDQINIRQSTFLAMTRAFYACPKRPDELWIDGIDTLNIDIKQKAVIKGDALMPVISAASIIAKVYRDRLMKIYDDYYPEFGLKDHSGYGTRKHTQALKQYGYVMGLHRKSFKPIATMSKTY